MGLLKGIVIIFHGSGIYSFVMIFPPSLRPHQPEGLSRQVEQLD